MYRYMCQKSSKESFNNLYILISEKYGSQSFISNSIELEESFSTKERCKLHSYIYERNEVTITNFICQSIFI